jgi:hypothetical protein
MAQISASSSPLSAALVRMMLEAWGLLPRENAFGRWLRMT